MLLPQPDIERVGIRAFDFRDFCHRQGEAIIHRAKILHLFIGGKFLIESIGRHGNHGQPGFLIFAVKILKPFILPGISAFGCRIDHKHRAATIITQRHFRSVNGFEAKSGRGTGRPGEAKAGGEGEDGIHFGSPMASTPLSILSVPMKKQA